MYLTLLKECPEKDEDANDNMEDEGTRSLTGVSVADDVITEIIFSEKTPSKCFMCKHLPTEPSPLRHDHQVSKTGGYWPWYRYKQSKSKTKDRILKRMPTGHVCSICRNCYKAIGYQAKYGSKAQFKNYKTVISKPSGADVHKILLNGVKTWIEMHNDADPKSRAGACTLKSAKKLNNTMKRLSVHNVKSVGFRAPQRTFVESESWDPARHGEFDKDKEEEIDLHGKKRKGIYCFLGDKRTGEWEEIDEQVTSMDKEVVEDEGDDDLTAMAIDTKEQILLDSLKGEKQRTLDKTHDAHFDLSDMLKNVCEMKKGDEVDGSAIDDDDDADDVLKVNSSGSEDGCDGEDSDSDLEESERLSFHFTGSSTDGQKVKNGDAKTKAKAKPVPTKGSGTSSAGKAGKQEKPGFSNLAASRVSGSTTVPTSSAASMSSCSGVSPSPSKGIPDRSDIMRIDGRALRLQSACEQVLKAETANLQALKFSEDHFGLVLLGEAQQEFMKQVAMKNKVCILARNNAKAQLTKIGESVHKTNDDMKTVNEKLITLSHQADALCRFCDVMIKPVTDLDKALETSKDYKKHVRLVMVFCHSETYLENRQLLEICVASLLLYSI